MKNALLTADDLGRSLAMPPRTIASLIDQGVIVAARPNLFDHEAALATLKRLGLKSKRLIRPRSGTMNMIR